MGLFDFLRTRKPVAAAAADEPDAPLPSGYKSQWWTVRSSSAEDVAEVIQLADPRPCNWSTGSRRRDQGDIFVTPAVNGWTMVCGHGLGPSGCGDVNDVTRRLKYLSQEFGESQVYATHRVVDFHLWARAENGKLIRGMGYCPDDGGLFWDEGYDSCEERLGLDLSEPNWRDDDDVLKNFGYQ